MKEIDTISLNANIAAPAKALEGVSPPDFSEEADWLTVRNGGLTPLHVSDLVTTQQDRDEFLEGARLLRFSGDRALPGRSPQPQQLLVADMLAAGHKRNAAMLPRRSSKSTSVIAVGLGRASKREDYRVGILTLTSGKAGRSRFLKDVAAPIERLYPDKKTRPLTVSRQTGAEGIIFPEGGGMYWLHTIEDIRGEAFDLLLLDESGEPTDPEKIKDVIAAALPTMDTRPGAQLVVLGTAGKFRHGNLLWDALELGRKGTGGIVEFSMPDATSEAALADWQPTEDNPEGDVRSLVLASHPGVGTLTTLESIEENYKSMTPEDFAREYGGIFGTIGGSSGIFNLEQWALAGSGEALPTPPADAVLTFTPHMDSLCASIVLTWRDEDGKACLLLADHRRGIDWLAPELLRLSRKYGYDIAYDSGKQVTALVAEQLNRAKPRPRLDPHAWADVKKAASLLVDEVDKGRVRHWRQPEMDAAAKVTVKRAAGSGGGWALGANLKSLSDDVTPMEAAALALYIYDSAKPKAPARLAKVVTR